MSLSITDPTVGGDSGSWGSKLNAALDAIVSYVNGHDTALAGKLAKAGDSMSGLFNALTVTLAHVHLASAASQTLNLATGQSFDVTITGATLFAISNTPATANSMCAFVLRLVNGGSAAITWPATVKWAAGSAPALTAAGTDVLVFISDDQGSTWRGAMSIKDAR